MPDKPNNKTKEFSLETYIIMIHWSFSFLGLPNEISTGLSPFNEGFFCPGHDGHVTELYCQYWPGELAYDEQKEWQKKRKEQGKSKRQNLGHTGKMRVVGGSEGRSK